MEKKRERQRRGKGRGERELYLCYEVMEVKRLSLPYAANGK